MWILMGSPSHWPRDNTGMDQSNLAMMGEHQQCGDHQGMMTIVSVLTDPVSLTWLGHSAPMERIWTRAGRCHCDHVMGTCHCWHCHWPGCCILTWRFCCNLSGRHGTGPYGPGQLQSHVTRGQSRDHSCQGLTPSHCLSPSIIRLISNAIILEYDILKY